MERWLNGTHCVTDVDAINADHPSQKLHGAAGPGGTVLYRAALLADASWADWHGVMGLMLETAAQPLPGDDPPLP